MRMEVESASYALKPVTSWIPASDGNELRGGTYSRTENAPGAYTCVQAQLVVAKNRKIRGIPSHAWCSDIRVRELERAIPCSSGLQGSYHLLDFASTIGWTMDGDVYVGDMVQLPSGLVFKVTFASDPARPWGAVQVGSSWRIRRKRLVGGTVTFYGGRTVPLKVDKADAEAVAAILNRAQFVSERGDGEECTQIPMARRAY